MTKRERKIFKAFNGKLVGKPFMKKEICEVLAILPADIVNFVTRNCWFVSSMEDAWGFTFTGNDIKKEHLIFLSDELFLQKEEQIHYTIAHEIGHVILNHRNSVIVEQSKEEIRQQEREADVFVRKHLNL